MLSTVILYQIFKTFPWHTEQILKLLTYLHYSHISLHTSVRLCHLLNQLSFCLATHKRDLLMMTYIIFNLFFSGNNNSEVYSPDWNSMSEGNTFFPNLVISFVYKGTNYGNSGLWHLLKLNLLCSRGVRVLQLIVKCVCLALSFHASFLTGELKITSKHSSLLLQEKALPLPHRDMCPGSALLVTG